MVSSLPAIAERLGADERSLRRAAARGVVRCTRPTPRGLDVEPGEIDYLVNHWDLLSRLTSALRTEPNVELAVLYGSQARGTDHAGSDVDVLVDFRDEEVGAVSRLARRLQAQVGREVDVARLSRVRRQAPLLVLQVIDEGRPLVDRADAWPVLRAQRETVARGARRQMTRLRREASQSVDEVLKGL